MGKKQNISKYLICIMNKINRRDFLSLVVSETKKPFSDSTFSVEFQGVTSYINKNITFNLFFILNLFFKISDL